jgi:4-methyl-5(b-hydroxyethyl)-thiazole monophosphate biosynthesis
MKRVLLLLADGFEALEGAAFTDVIGWANTFGSEPIELVTAGLRPKLRCTFGFTVIPDVLIADVAVEGFDAVAVPGGFGTAGFYEDAYSEPLLELLRRFRKAGRPIASVCVGALPVAKSGILRGLRATTYHLGGGNRRRQLAELGARVVDEALVVDDGIITSTSPATAVDVALKLVELLTSKENAQAVRKLMGF